MNEKNPTVALHVTSKELALIERVLGYNAAPGSLRDKLNAAHKEMILTNREKNRANKLARLHKKQSLIGASYTYQHEPMPVSDLTAEQLAVLPDD